ncbi:MAG: TerB family tellurite resistance protein, partial [Pseudomonadota bacterium]|nr:TerB family tellurite resistance protein [Pseudomonadota bacterium]
VMIEQIKNFLRLAPQTAEKSGDGDALQCAVTVLLVRAARLAGQFVTVEHDASVAAIGAHFELTAPAAAALIEEAAAIDADSTDLYRFSKTIRVEMDHDQRLAMMEMLWHVIYADGEVHDHEAALMRRLAGLLYVSDQESGTLRRRVRDKLGLA